jgi:hypothetical protein
VWGEVSMPAHPTLPQTDARQIVSYIMSLANKTAQRKSLPPTGTIMPDASQKPGSTLVLSASYTDKGGNNLKALTGNSVASLRNNTVMFTGKEKMNGFSVNKKDNVNSLVLPQSGGWFALDSLDLTDVRSVNIMSGWQEKLKAALDFEVRMDTPDGKLLGTGSMQPSQNDKNSGVIRVPIETVNDGRFHTVYFIYKPKDANSTLQGGVSMVQF